MSRLQYLANHPEEITMQDVLHQLQRECGPEAFDIFEWYCATYRVDVSDPAPVTIRYEVFDF